MSTDYTSRMTDAQVDEFMSAAHRAHIEMKNSGRTINEMFGIDINNMDKESFIKMIEQFGMTKETVDAIKHDIDYVTDADLKRMLDSLIDLLAEDEIIIEEETISRTNNNNNNNKEENKMNNQANNQSAQVNNWSEQASGLVNTVVNSVTELFGGIVNTVITLITTACNFVLNMFGSLVGAITGAVSNIGNSFTMNANNIRS